MTSLQKQLRHLLAFYGHPGIDLDQAVADVEGVIKEAGCIHSELKEKTEQLLQDMTNMHVNMKHDLLRLGMSATPTKHTADFSKGKSSKLGLKNDPRYNPKVMSDDVLNIYRFAFNDPNWNFGDDLPKVIEKNGYINTEITTERLAGIARQIATLGVK